MALSPGSRLGPYEIVTILGAGGMGEVYRARDSRLGRDVAIKVLPREFADDPERVARFQREARVLASLTHPHIGAIYGFEESDGRSALVLELVEGLTLAEHLTRPLRLTEALPESGRNQVYVRQVSGSGAATQVSTDGGEEPVWAPNGRELFFRRGPSIMVVKVGVGEALSVGAPEELFKRNYAGGGVRAGYDIAPDGQRFLFVNVSQAPVDSTRFTIVMNWLEEMTARLSSR